MQWTQVLTVVLGILIPMFIMMFTMYREMQREVKDFHGRLCRLEERYLDVKLRGNFDGFKPLVSEQRRT